MKKMDQVKYYRSHPARCLAGFLTRSTELPGVEFDGHLSLSQLDEDLRLSGKISAPEHINPVFGLSCKCGGDRHYVHGYRWANPDYHNEVVFLSPLRLECAQCNELTDLLDTDIHGYDGEWGHGSATARGKGDETVFECPICGRQPMETFVRFEYPDDLFDRDYAKFAGRQQDLFTWFSLVGRCPKCSEVLPITEFECA
jgi:hypothetical protein